MNWQTYGELVSGCGNFLRETSPLCNDPVKVSEIMRPLILQHEFQEGIYVIALDARMQAIDTPHLVFLGALDRSIISPREIIGYLLGVHAICFVMVHNHPSGDVTPSDPDKKTTDMVYHAGKTVDIQLIDHVVVSKFSYHSFRANGFFAQYK
jgi:DNA repair protein RadC